MSPISSGSRQRLMPATSGAGAGAGASTGAPAFVSATEPAAPLRTANSAEDSWSPRDSACRPLRFLLPILAIYTLFSFAWTSPIASVLRAADPVAHHRTPKGQFPVSQSRDSPSTITKTSASTTADAGLSTPATKETTSTSDQDTTTSTITSSVSEREESTSGNNNRERKTDDVSGNTEHQTDNNVMSDNDDGDDELFQPTTHRRQLFSIPEPECMRSKTRAKTFLMVFMGHSGSTAILSELKSHPDAFVDKFEPVDHSIYLQNTTLALEYTRQFFKEGIAAGKVPGFKIRPYHINSNPEAWAALTREYDTRIIWQYRENTLKQAVGEYSYRVLNDTLILEGLRNEDQVSNRCDIGAGCNFEISDLDSFHRILNDILHSDLAISQAVESILNGRDCLHELRYEDYLYHRKGTIVDVLNFLGLKQVETEVSRFKATRDNLCEVVSNWNDLCRAFYGCKVWRFLFEDDRNGCACKFSTSPSKFCLVNLAHRWARDRDY